MFYEIYFSGILYLSLPGFIFKGVTCDLSYLGSNTLFEYVFDVKSIGLGYFVIGYLNELFSTDSYLVRSGNLSID